MSKKRQFQTAAQRRTFFDRKVLRYGYSATVSMGKIIPKTWRYVRVRKLEETPNKIIIEIEKLMGDADYALTPKTNKANRQNP